MTLSITPGRLADSIATSASDAEMLASLAIDYHTGLGRYMPFKVIEGKTSQATSLRDFSFAAQYAGRDLVKLSNLLDTFTVDYLGWRLDRLSWDTRVFYTGVAAVLEDYANADIFACGLKIDQAACIYAPVADGVPLAYESGAKNQYIVFFEYTGPR